MRNVMYHVWPDNYGSLDVHAAQYARSVRCVRTASPTVPTCFYLFF